MLPARRPLGRRSIRPPRQHQRRQLPRQSRQTRRIRRSFEGAEPLISRRARARTTLAHRLVRPIPPLRGGHRRDLPMLLTIDGRKGAQLVFRRRQDVVHRGDARLGPLGNTARRRVPDRSDRSHCLNYDGQLPVAPRRGRRPPKSPAETKIPPVAFRIVSGATVTLRASVHRDTVEVFSRPRFDAARTVRPVRPRPAPPAHEQGRSASDLIHDFRGGALAHGPAPQPMPRFAALRHEPRPSTGGAPGPPGRSSSEHPRRSAAAWRHRRRGRTSPPRAPPRSLGHISLHGEYTRTASARISSSSRDWPRDASRS